VSGARAWTSVVGGCDDIMNNRKKLHTFLSKQFREIRENESLDQRMYAYYGFRSQSQFRDACADVQTALQRLVRSLDDVKIPFTVYFGPSADITRIYHCLNRRNTQLSDMDRYAVEWMWYGSFPIATPEVADALYENYISHANERGINYSNTTFDFDPNRFRERTFNFHQYCRGLGGHLLNLFPGLVAHTDHPITVALSALRCVYGQRNNDVLPGLVLGVGEGQPNTTLSSSLPGFTFTPAVQRQLETNIIHGLNMVGGAIEPFRMHVGKTDIKDNGENNVGYGTHFCATNHIWSLVGRYCQLARAEDTTALAGFQRNLKFHIMFDVLEKKWQTGVTQLAVVRSSTPHYEYSIPIGRWRAMVEQLFQNGLQGDVSDRRTRPKTVTEALLKFTYSNVLTHNDAKSLTLEYDHVVPFKTLHTLGNTCAAKVPVNHIANMAILDRRTNRRKKDTTLHAFVQAEMKQNIGKSNNRRELEKLVLFHDMEQLQFVDSGDFTLDRYVEFLRMRWTCLIDKFFAVNTII
jgi:hypothetical protein